MALDFNMPVLVVDDYRIMLRIIRNLLRQLGFANVDGASGGGEALEMMGEKEYGLVISDWNMAPMSGFELLRQMRARQRFSRTPFIMVAPEAKKENVAVAQKTEVVAGASYYIFKPFNGAMLKSRIDSLFAEGRSQPVTK